MLKTQQPPLHPNHNWVQMLEDEYQGRQTHAFGVGCNIPLYAQDIWIVCRGVVRLCTVDPEGHESILGLVCPDMPFGRPLTQITAYEAIALTDVVLMRIDQAELEQSPLLAQKILMHLNRRLQQSEVLLSIVNRRLVRERVGQLVMFLAKEIGEETADGVRLKVRLTHQQIAELTGTTRISVTRNLSSFRREGWLSSDKARHLIVHGSAAVDF